MSFKTSVTFLSLPFAALMFLQGSSCKSSGVQSNSVVTSVPVQSNQSKPSPAPATPSPNPRAVATGTWGGQHIALNVNDNGAEIDYDCAHGSIAERIVPDGEGKFVVKGRHVKERGGPVRHDEDHSGEAALYHGSIDGETMTLTVTLPGTRETVGTYTLTRGKIGRIRKCL
jgi:hypothetical protein